MRTPQQPRRWLPPAPSQRNTGGAASPKRAQRDAAGARPRAQTHGTYGLCIPGHKRRDSSLPRGWGQPGGPADPFCANPHLALLRRSFSLKKTNVFFREKATPVAPTQPPYLRSRARDCGAAGRRVRLSLTFPAASRTALRERTAREGNPGAGPGGGGFAVITPLAGTAQLLQHEHR